MSCQHVGHAISGRHFYVIAAQKLNIDKAIEGTLYFDLATSESRFIVHYFVIGNL